MDASISNISQQQPGGAYAGVRASPPGTSTSSPQNMLSGPPHSFAIAPAGRTSGLSAPLPPLGSRSPGGYNPPSYSHPYITSSTSPSTAPGSLQDAQANDVTSLSTPGISPTQISSSSLNAQKRAYRQRRKDPSCDACRERKVKCDATETSACSECSSRNHKCQFTKETNRRMSSIKQVQDLQSQLAELRQENTHLRTRVPDRVVTERDRGPLPTQQPEGHVLTPNLARKIQPPVMKNFDNARKNIQTHSRGIFDLPFQNQHSAVSTGIPSAASQLPPHSEFAHLSRYYLESIHESFPILHWPSFHDEVDQVYTARSFQGKSSEWIGLFFAVMACGTLQTPQITEGSPKLQSRGGVFYETAVQVLASSSSPQDLTMTHPRVELLLSLFAMESNMISPGATWLASAVRHAQLLRLHMEVEGSILETEMRRRLWWSISTWDKISSIGAGLPPLLNDDDSEVALPSPLEDRYIQSQGFARPHMNQPPFTDFLGLIHAVQPFTHLYRALKPSTVTSQALQQFEEKLHSTLSLLPESYRLGPDVPSEPAALPSVVALQTARFLLYRRNISPLCRPPERADALRKCTSTAQDTAKYISRTMQTPSGRPDLETWRTRVVPLASNMMCRHLWHCTLMLCFRAEYEAALTCVQLSSTIGGIRKLNTACGKHVAFFLDRLLDRIRSGIGGQHQLEHDEEMLAYVSGDMQGDPLHSWIWAGGDLGGQSSPYTSRPGGFPPQNPDQPMQNTSLPLRPVPESNGQNERDWDGWARIEQVIRQLLEEYRARLAQPTPYYPPPHNPVKRVQLAPDAPASPPRAGPLPSPTPSSASRISIANII